MSILNDLYSKQTKMTLHPTLPTINMKPEMRIAVFSDIHSNSNALDKILQDIQGQNPDATICLGDLVGYDPHPNEVVETLREFNIPPIKGNYDDGVGYERGDCDCAYVSESEEENGKRSIEWTTEKTTSKNKKFLRELISRIEVKYEGFRFLLVHGSPRRVNEYLYEDRPTDSLRRMLKPLDIDVLVCGHTHKPYHRIIDGIHIINDGSVGKPKDGDPRACYALINVEDEVSVEFRRVSYPVEKVTQELIEAGLPDAFAQELRTGGR